MDVGNAKGMLRIEVVNGTQLCPGHVSHQVVAWTDNQPTKREDAAFIVRACNSHTALVAALERAARELSDCEDHLARLRPGVQPDPYVTGCREAFEIACSALTLARQ